MERDPKVLIAALDSLETVTVSENLTGLLSETKNALLMQVARLATEPCVEGLAVLNACRDLVDLPPARTVAQFAALESPTPDPLVSKAKPETETATETEPKPRNVTIDISTKQVCVDGHTTRFISRHPDEIAKVIDVISKGSPDIGVTMNDIAHALGYIETPGKSFDAKSSPENSALYQHLYSILRRNVFRITDAAGEPIIETRKQDGLYTYHPVVAFDTTIVGKSEATEPEPSI